MTATYKKRMTKAAFCLALEDVQEWGDIRELVGLCDQKRFWDQEFLGKATYLAKADFVRRMIKELKDEDGIPLWGSVEITQEDGKVVRVYKQEDHFDVEDYKQIVAYNTDRAKYHRDLARKYKERCEAKYGKQQWLF